MFVFLALWGVDAVFVLPESHGWIHQHGAWSGVSTLNKQGLGNEGALR